METVAQGFIKYAFDHKQIYFALGGPVMYTIICGMLYYLYNFERMALLNGWWNIATSISVTLYSIFILGESLKKTETFGLSLVLLGAGFLNLDKLGLNKGT
jgi:multidrug transporter EmrE-like cation transporter